MQELVFWLYYDNAEDEEAIATICCNTQASRSGQYKLFYL